jgi:ABC-type uncharacterized transport system YnjBCD substrate-binding protein
MNLNAAIYEAEEEQPPLMATIGSIKSAVPLLCATTTNSDGSEFPFDQEEIYKEIMEKIGHSTNWNMAYVWKQVGTTDRYGVRVEIGDVEDPETAMQNHNAWASVKVEGRPYIVRPRPQKRDTIVHGGKYMS